MLDELHGHVLAVEVEIVAVEHVGLDPVLLPVEVGVGAHGGGRRPPVPVDDQVTGVHAVGGDGGMSVELEVGRREAEFATAVVTVDHRSLDAVRTPQEARRLDDIALGDQGTDATGRDLLAVLIEQGNRVDDESRRATGLLQSDHTARASRTEPEVLPHDHADGGEPFDQAVVDEGLGR